MQWFPAHSKKGPGSNPLEFVCSSCACSGFPKTLCPPPPFPPHTHTHSSEKCFICEQVILTCTPQWNESVYEWLVALQRTVWGWPHLYPTVPRTALTTPWPPREIQWNVKMDGWGFCFGYKYSFSPKSAWEQLKANKLQITLFSFLLHIVLSSSCHFCGNI